MKCEKLYNQLFLLTFFEIESFEKQKKHTQLLFEDFFMLLLNIAIWTEIIYIPFIEHKMTGLTLTAQFTTTVLSIISTCINLYTESRGLYENLLEYIMTSVKAKQDWVPFGYKLQEGKIEKTLIDYSRIEFKIRYLTDAFGYYRALEYQFNEHSLQKFATHILLAQEKKIELSRDQNEEQADFNIPRIHLGFSVTNVSVHAFLHFIDQV